MQSPNSPRARRPALTVVKPSTSFSGSMASITRAASMCVGSGICTRIPCTDESALSDSTWAIRPASESEAGKRWSNATSPASCTALLLAAT